MGNPDRLANTICGYTFSFEKNCKGMQTQIVFDVLSRIIQSQYLGSIFLNSVLAQFTQLTGQDGDQNQQVGVGTFDSKEFPDYMFLFHCYRVFDNERNIALAYYFDLFDVVPVTRLEAFRALKVIGQKGRFQGAKTLQIGEFQEPTIRHIGEFQDPETNWPDLSILGP